MYLERVTYLLPADVFCKIYVFKSINFIYVFCDGATNAISK